MWFFIYLSSYRVFWGIFCKSINAVILFVFLYYLKIIIQNVLIYQKGENAKNIFKELLLDKIKKYFQGLQIPSTAELFVPKKGVKFHGQNWCPWFGCSHHWGNDAEYFDSKWLLFLDLYFNPQILWYMSYIIYFSHTKFII